MPYTSGMAKKIEELPIYHKAVAFWSAVNALLESPGLRRNRRLHEQISDANDSVTYNMVEGFEQATVRAFANFLTHSKASLAEVLVRLKQAYFKKYISEAIEATTDKRRRTRQDAWGLYQIPAPFRLG